MKNLDLASIKSQIESTVDKKGLGIGQREFIWSYKLGHPIKRLREVNSFNMVLNGGIENGVSYLLPKYTNNTTLIHNHPNGTPFPSPWDVLALLNASSKHPTIKNSLIAATKENNVVGFYLMTYTGDPSKAEYLSQKANNRHDVLINIRRLQIENYPKQFDILWGANIFSYEEQKKISLELMFESKIGGIRFPFPI